MIHNPLNYVRQQKPSYCVCCERDVPQAWWHSKYPGMLICVECLDNHGNMSQAHHKPLDDMKVEPGWHALAKHIGREVVSF